MIKVRNFSSNFKHGEAKEKSKELLMATTMHGIQNIIRTENTPIRIIWVICFIVSACLCCYWNLISIFNYLDFDVVTSTLTVYEHEAEFPTVSICSPVGILNESSIKKCVFNQDDCISYFEIFNDESYGTCIKFNSGVNNNNETVESLNSYLSGRYYGLRLDLSIFGNDTIDFTELVVYLHNKSLKPSNFYNKGFYLSSGSINNFQIDRLFDEKLESPYNDCYKNIDEFKKNKTIINLFKQLNSSYSQLECIRYCRNLLTLERSMCNCILTINSSYNCLHYDNETRYCYNNFIHKVLKKNITDLCSAYCPFECDTKDILVEVNTVQLPSTGKINNKVDSYSDIFKSYKELKKQYFRINMYYPELKYTLIKQDAKTELVDLVSNIGGTLGLFLGISFLSFIEYIELFIEIVLIYIKK